MNKTYIISLVVLLSISLSTKNFAQKCAKKPYCSKEQLGDFDYRSQSHYAELFNGETQRVEIVVYANQNYRLLVCTDPKLGNVEYKIFNLYKRPKKVMQDVYEKEVTIYKQAANGEFDYDENGNKVVLGTKMVNDTIWQRKTVKEEELIFDSRTISFKPPYWETTTSKTGMMLIETFVDESEDPRSGCVNVLVGRKASKSKSKTRK